MDSMEAALNLIMGHLGIGTKTESPKTSAKLRPATSVSPAKSKGRVVEVEETDEDEIRIVCPEGRADGRIRIPKAAFNAKGTCFVDGVKYTAYESDGFRSTKLQPSVFGADEGDTIVLTRDSGNRWDSSVEGQRKSRKTATKATPAKSTPAKASKPEPKSAKLPVPEKATGSFKSQLKEIAAMAIENANDDFVNENIVNQGTFETDARMYLTTAQNKQFKRVWKNVPGMTLGKAVRALNAEVWED